MEKVSVVIPCYNEEKGIPALIEQLRRLFTITHGGKYSYELVFVDDGSTDNTGRLLRDEYANRPDVKIMTHERNMGYGNALKTGFKSSSGDLIVCYDGDCTTPVEDILQMLEMMKGDIDIVSGSAFRPGGNAGKVLWYRLILSRTLIRLYKLILGRTAGNITSFTLSFRAYRRRVINDINFKSGDFLAASEILILALKKGFKVTEYPTTLVNREHGKSKMKIITTIFSHISFIFKIFRWRSQKEK